jgi:uncharacterized protein (TIGR03067 family)
MHGSRLLSAVVLFALLASAAAAQTTDPALASLQGRWVVTGGEHDGKPMDSIKGGVMTITGGAFEVRTASGNLLKGTLRVDPSKRPAHMDLLHADGERWDAIYEVAGDSLKLNYVEAGGKDPRPAAFTTSDKTEESIVMFRREAR